MVYVRDHAVCHRHLDLWCLLSSHLFPGDQKYFPCHERRVRLAKYLFPNYDVHGSWNSRYVREHPPGTTVLLITRWAVPKVGYYLPWMLAGTSLSAIGYGLLSMLTPTYLTGARVGYQIIAGAGCGCAAPMVRFLPCHSYRCIAQSNRPTNIISPSSFT